MKEEKSVTIVWSLKFSFLINDQKQEKKITPLEKVKSVVWKSTSNAHKTIENNLDH